MPEVIKLSGRRPPVCYSVHIIQHWDDRLEVFVDDIASDERSRRSAADAMRRAADLIENPDIEPEHVKR